MSNLRTAAPALLLAGLVCAGPVFAQQQERPPSAGPADFSAKTAADARRIVEKAAAAVRSMTSDQQLADLLMDSKSVFILPDVLKGGLIVGGRGGEGVLLVQNKEGWSDPAFFNLGAITLGAQAGGAVGPVVMLLMSDQAVESFAQDDFALDASAGLSVFGYDVAGRTGTDEGDVIVWSDQAGAFAGATIGASDITIDQDKNHAYYRQPVELDAILAGEVENPHLPHIQEALPGGA